MSGDLNKGDRIKKTRSTRQPTQNTAKANGEKSKLSDGVRHNPKAKQVEPSPKKDSVPSNEPTNDKSNEPLNNKSEQTTTPNPTEKSGVVDKAKNMTSDATGVDYSDKSKKDQLEHQAADVVMDATPGLSQFNSARKALKTYNKAKKDAGGKEGITDKVEDVADDAVDKGIKGAKLVVGANLGMQAGGAAMLMAMAIKTLMMLKGMALAVLGKVAGFFGGIFSAVSSFISGVLGVAAGVGQAIAGVVMSIVVASAGILGYGLVDSVTKKDDTGSDCVPSKTRVSEESQEYVTGGGGIDVTHEENAKKLWSVYSKLGGSKTQAAAVLGNLHHESSGLDPTAVETIYDEPFQMGSSKQDAMAKDFKVADVAPAYAARFPAIEYMGIGLAQWTNGRNRLLIKFAKDQNMKWYEFDTQVKFMLAGDDKARQEQLKSFLKASSENVSKETESFMNTWIGLSSPNASLSDRLQYATDYMFILERAEVDTAYADSILSGLNVNRGEGNAAAGAFHQDDGCGKPVKSHYGDDTADGTGEVPADLQLVPWTRESLPESLKEFAKNPEDAGLAWGNASGWASGIYPDQCAALAHSYFMRLYPDWNKDGRATTRPFGDGKDAAPRWAAHYNESTSSTPKAGAVFSDSTTSSAGHTGIVQHVFANGDILINEQNVPGVSGAGANMNYSWSWRVIKKDRYLQAKWTFFKPSTAEPQWNRSGN